MTDDEILAIADATNYSCCIYDDEGTRLFCVAFARAIEAAEREACAKVCDDWRTPDTLDTCCDDHLDDALKACAAAIRSRTTESESP